MTGRYETLYSQYVTSFHAYHSTFAHSMHRDSTMFFNFSGYVTLAVAKNNQFMYEIQLCRSSRQGIKAQCVNHCSLCPTSNRPTWQRYYPILGALPTCLAVLFLPFIPLCCSLYTLFPLVWCTGSCYMNNTLRWTSIFTAALPSGNYTVKNSASGLYLNVAWSNAAPGSMSF